MESHDSTSTRSTTWHIVWQAVEGRSLSTDRTLVKRIRGRLLAAHKLPGRALLHYLITPTELHLLSRLPPGTTPSGIARQLGSVVARWVREAQRTPGFVFAGRYRSYAMESDEATRNELRMLAWRPVVLGLCAVPIHHVTSSLRMLLAQQAVLDFDIHPALELFGATLPEERAAMHDMIGRRRSGIELRQWELSCGLVLAPGNAGTLSSTTRGVDGLATALVAASEPQGIDGALRLLERWVLLKIGSPELHDLATMSTSTGARGRALVAIVAARLNLCSSASVARHYGRAKATLSERMAACRRQAADQAILKVPLDRIVEDAITFGNGGVSSGLGVQTRNT